MKIHSYAAHEAKTSLKEYLFDSARLGEYDIEIKITHCGMCHSDIHLIDNDWFSSIYPLVPGHEIIGNVTAAGSKVTNIKVGKRVGVGWQSGSCLECEWCLKGFENHCKHNVATCVGRPGGYADYIITDSRFAFPIPEQLESETAAPLLCGGITVYSPLKFYNVLPQHRVGIIGIGGLGHLAVQYASAMGCEVTAFSSSRDKEKEAMNLGAHKFINSTDPNQLKAAEESFDFILSTATAPLDWMQFIKALRPNGKLCFVGGTVGNLNIPVGILLGGQKSVCGSIIGGRAAIKEMLEFSARHNIKAVTETFPMKNVNDAIERLRQNKARYRIVLKN